MPEPFDHVGLRGLGTRGLQAVLAGAAVLALLGTWHTLSQDFALDVPLAGLLAAVQAVPLATALRWPLPSWATSLVALLAAAALVPHAAGDGLWPDPNLYVHLGVVFLAAVRLGPAMWTTMWVVLVGTGLVLTVTGSGATGSPGLAETIGMATVAVTVAGVLARALQARDQAVVRLAEQERFMQAERARAARLEERARIARELHDVVAHHMSVVAMQAEAAPLRMVESPEAVTRAFGTIRESAVDGLAELRRVVGLLRATDDEATAPQPGLADVIDLVDNVRTTGIQVAMSVHGTPRPLSAGLELSAYRIVQESLNNVMRHAPGAEVEVELCYLDDRLEVTVANSTSPQIAPPGPPGHGLLGMHERVAMLGGKLEVGPCPNGGYVVTAALPTSAQDDP